MKNREWREEKMQKKKNSIMFAYTSLFKLFRTYFSFLCVVLFKLILVMRFAAIRLRESVRLFVTRPARNPDARGKKKKE